jgi:hypothetical protein
MTARDASDGPSIGVRIRGLDWEAAEASLCERGYARTSPILTATECSGLIALYDDDRRFRTRIDMEQHRFGVGDYAYFGHPLPRLVRELRIHLYRRLAPIANRWAEAAGNGRRFPPTLAPFLAQCRSAGQTRPTPLLLRYREGGYNCLHRDLYGEVAFPLQVACVLSRAGTDYEGGEFLLVEQRPRSQARGEAIVLGRGELLVFPVAQRPVEGRRGVYRTSMRHGVSSLRRGERFTLGIIFHDAR